MRPVNLASAARLAAACLLMFCLSGAALAAEEIDVQVTTIHGTNAHSEVSAELKSVEGTLKKKFKCSGFKQLKQSNGKATDKRPYVADLVESYKARVTAVERKNTRITVQLEITRAAPKPKDEGKDKKDDGEKGKDKKEEPKPKEEIVASTKLTFDAGTSQFVNVPYPGKSDDLLIIAVSAK